MAHKITFKKTDTALEALFLEAELIKQHQPPYNIKQKDDKSSAYLIITAEKFPRLVITRPTALQRFKIKDSFGPFKSKKELEQALRIIRRIFPYHSDKNFKKPCFHYQIKLCPGPCAGKISPQEYRKNIKNLALIFRGKKKSILGKLKKEMESLSKLQEFEKATTIRNVIFSLENLRDIILSRKETINWKIMKDIPPRLEAYDISNISGQYAVGSMVVFNNGRKDQTEYRKFKIRNKNTPDDTGMLKEVLKRRFQNNWTRPNAIFIDGGPNQLKAAYQIIKEFGLKIPLFSGAKGPNRKGFRVYRTIKNSKVNRELLKEASLEAHRFAIAYHRKLRDRIN